MCSPGCKHVSCSLSALEIRQECSTSHTGTAKHASHQSRWALHLSRKSQYNAACGWPLQHRQPGSMHAHAATLRRVGLYHSTSATSNNTTRVAIKDAHLNEPEHIVRVELVLAVPGGQDVPLHLLAAIDGDAVLGMLVLAGLQIHQDLLCQLSQEAPMQNIILPQQ